MNNIKQYVFRQASIHALLWLLWSWTLFGWMNAHVLMRARVSSSLNDFGNMANFPLLDIVLFIVGQIIAYGVLAFVIYLVAYPALKKLDEKHARPGMFIHFIGLIVAYSGLLLHQYLFPSSAHPLSRILPLSSVSSGEKLIYILPVLLFFTLLLFSAWFWLKKINQSSLRYVFWVFLIAAILFVTLVDKVAPLAHARGAVQEQPNIILLGVDSFSLDMFKQLDDEGFLKNFVSNAVVFSDTKTPLARTYVAWMSLLSASYPINNGVRFNLYPRTGEQQSKMLLGDFKTAGYQIYYGSDERRFSNLDKFHGFDGIIGPPIGAMDFLLGGMVDMPFTNLLLATPLGKYIFPYSYANRAVAHAYDYHDYLDLMDNSLDDFSQNTAPLFLATHLCLGHWPYYYRDTRGEESKDRYFLYQKSIAAMDQMAGKLYDNLRQRGLLKNALVILISDHGEGFPDKYKNFSGLKPPSSYGHGTNLLDKDQNNVIFAVQYFKNGKMQFPVMDINYPASLIDVLPTVAGVLGLALKDSKSLDGLDLYPLISGEPAELPQLRPRFLETEIHLQSISGTPDGQDIDVGSVLRETAKYYRVSGDGRLELNTAYLPQFLKEKDRAVELRGLYLTWNDDYGYRVYDRLTGVISQYDPVSAAHQQVMAFFCDHFLVDIKAGYVLPNLCNKSVSL